MIGDVKWHLAADVGNFCNEGVNDVDAVMRAMCAGAGMVVASSGGAHMIMRADCDHADLFIWLTGGIVVE